MNSLLYDLLVVSIDLFEQLRKHFLNKSVNSIQVALKDTK